MSTTKQVKLKNVDLNVLNNLILQSLEVSNQLMFEFTPEILKSVSFSSTETFIKLWAINIPDLIRTRRIMSEDEEITEELDFEPTTTILEESIKEFTETFNFYLLKGDSFKNFLSVFAGETIDIDFNLIEGSDGKLQTHSITVYGKTEFDRELQAKLNMTTEEMITNKVSDYSQILQMCKPSESMSEITMTLNSLKELKKIISNTNKSHSNNSSFVSFKLEDNKLRIYDKVFDIVFDDLIINNFREFEFNILKSDFKLIGNHSYKIYSNEDDSKIHFGTQYGKAIIWCLSTKPISTNDIMSDNTDTLSSDDLSNYGIEDDFDDIVF